MARLQRDRQGSAPYLINFLSYARVVFQAVAVLTLINYALYKIDADAFNFDAAPSLAVFVRYSMIALYGGEISALQPTSDLANVVSTLAVVLGLLILATLVLTVVLSFRQTKDDTAIRQSVLRIQAEGASAGRTAE